MKIDLNKEEELYDYSDNIQEIVDLDNHISIPNHPVHIVMDGEELMVDVDIDIIYHVHTEHDEYGYIRFKEAEKQDVTVLMNEAYGLDGYLLEMSHDEIIDIEYKIQDKIKNLK